MNDEERLNTSGNPGEEESVNPEDTSRPENADTVNREPVQPGADSTESAQEKKTAEPAEAQRKAEPAGEQKKAEPEVPDQMLSDEERKAQEKKKAKEQKKAARAHKKKLRKEGKHQAEVYLTELHDADPDQRKVVKAAEKAKLKKRKLEVKQLPKSSQADEKQIRKGYKKRINRLRTCIVWAVIIALLAGIFFKMKPMMSMMVPAIASQQNYRSMGKEVREARKEGRIVAAELCDEGFVLLKNDDGFLPLNGDTRINVFGDDAYNFVYGGSGSAGADQSNATTLFEAMKKVNLLVNPDLDRYYRKDCGLSGKGNGGSPIAMVKAFLSGAEESPDWHTVPDEVMDAAYLYSDTALIVLSAQEVESNEINEFYLKPMYEGSEKAALIQKVCEKFDHVIVIVNSGNTMELSFVEDYDSVDACLFVSAPGSEGCLEIARTLVGEVNPSGRTVDTWPVSISDNPAYITYGDFAYQKEQGASAAYKALKNHHILTYNEGIYVGYRYYETWFSDDEEAYRKQVLYPFGYGLSYTEFSESIVASSESEDSVSVTVQVKNTGRVSGKDVVELYFKAPWYAESGIEKSVIELGAFGKTKLLAPGEVDTVKLTIPVRDMASYSEKTGSYILEHGDYTLAVGTDVHQAMSSDLTRTYTVNEDIIYQTDDATGTEIQNLFTDAAGTETYMSRADRTGTFPKAPEGFAATKELKDELKEYEKYPSSYSTEKTEEPVYGAENGLQLNDLKNLPYDDPKWELFLDQFTAKEMMKFVANGGWHTIAIQRLGIPESHLLDGPSGINSMFSALDAVGYPMETLVSSSWNTEMGEKLGSAVGTEANAYGVQSWYAPAMNIHRTAIGGRNCEYFSEDPLLSGAFGAAVTRSVQEKGVTAVMKHFVCNDMELNARSDVRIYVTEQALREIYLKPFEMTVKEGNAHGCMSAFSRIGVSWAGGSSALLTDLLREEWGFEGFVTTDAVLGDWMNVEAAVKNGNDLMLEMGMQKSDSRIRKAYRKDPIGVSWSLRDSVHHVLYTLVNYSNITN